MSEEWKWVEKFVLALEDPTLRRRTYIYGDEAYQLIACIKALKEVAEATTERFKNDFPGRSTHPYFDLEVFILRTLAKCKEGKFE